MTRVNDKAVKLLPKNPFIIAEIGSNWTEVPEILDSIKAAKESGAHAVKLQAYSHLELYGYEGPRMPHELRKELIPTFKEHADKVGIEFMCTAFSPHGLEYIDQYVNIHKIASSDLSYVSLLKAAKATNKLLLLSTGAHNYADLEGAMKFLNPELTIPLDCVSAYPSRCQDPRRIKHLTDTTPYVWGFSDHTTMVAPIPQIAIESGAVVIEKHFKLREMNTPDNPHSLTPSQFKLMVECIQNPNKFIEKSWLPEEQDMILRHNRRLFARVEIAKGDKLIEGETFVCARSKEVDTKALPGFVTPILEGKPSPKHFKARDPIHALQ